MNTPVMTVMPSYPFTKGGRELTNIEKLRRAKPIPARKRCPICDSTMHKTDETEKSMEFLCYYCGTKVVYDFIKPYQELLDDPKFIDEWYE